GPVAVVSLMTAATLGSVATPGSAEYVAAAMVLALLSGLMLIAMGLLRLGFLANFLSHPVISGFISASGIIIAASQLKHILGIKAHGENLVDLLRSLWQGLAQTNPYSVLIGVGAIGMLVWIRSRLKSTLVAHGCGPRLADALAKAGPVLVVVLSTLVTWLFDLRAQGLATVGAVPGGLPALSMPAFDGELWRGLLLGALLISIIGFVESVSVAQTLAARRRQRIVPDQELIGLGASNAASAFSGGFPVTGGFSRSVVNYDAGAQTPAAGIFTAGGITLAALFLTPFLYYLPTATLAATIMVAVLSLVDLRALGRTFRYSRSDFAAMATTIGVTLLDGVETGIVAGVGLSVALYLFRTSRPHSAVVGQVPGTEHFRNVDRHQVVTTPEVFSIRVDESLYFPNARFLEDRIADAIATEPGIRHVVLMCPAVNFIDSSALESLEAINERLGLAGIKLHLSEVKGPVMDRLQRSDFLEHLSGQVFLTQYDALFALAPELTRRTLQAPRTTAAAGP
ncbi:MAG: STAS domain-containing protein, partial [Gammaproteobacteria bacterium]|nr:STAS domain-containing protein [Gammaproteobacteria bacterium]